MTYKEIIKQTCEGYAKEWPKCVFLGYNIQFGSEMYGTVSNVSPSQKLEMPVAENLMMGMAIGMSLMGYRPVVCFERQDFMLLALDALVNHADKMPTLSNNQFKLPIMVRAIVGASQPLSPGPQHVQDYSEQLKGMLRHSEVVVIGNRQDAEYAYARVGKTESGVVVGVEYRDLYKDTI